MSLKDQEIKIVEINNIIKKLDPQIKKIVVKCNIDHRDEISQEIRIKIWRYINNKFEKLDNPELIDEAYKICNKYLNVMMFYSSRPIYKKYGKQKELSFNDPGFSPSINYNQKLSVDFLDWEIDFEKYKAILKPAEYEYFVYVVKDPLTLANMDSLSRQWGFDGKGSAAYNIQKIFEKIQKYNDNLVESGAKV